MLTKTRSILRRSEDVDGFVCWAQDVDEGEEPDRAASVTPDLFEELGRPEVITLTIELGDRLNPPGSSDPHVRAQNTWQLNEV